jgi:tetratricopeptide (TPR) repeat protein
MGFMKVGRLAVVLGGLALVAAASAQTSEEEILKLVRKNGLEATRSLVRRAAEKSPDTAAALYFKSLLEPDGEAAKAGYEEIVRRYPRSSFGQRAQMKLAKYYFALGSYRTAREHFLACRDNSTDAETAAEAAYLAAWSLYAAGQRQQAAEEMRQAAQRYSRSPYVRLIVKDLQEWTKVSTAPTRRDEIDRGRYTVQVGAFTERANALSQRDYLSGFGLEVELAQRVKGGRTFYLVWVGRFASKEEAQRYGEEFKRRFKKPYRVVEVPGQP